MSRARIAICGLAADIVKGASGVTAKAKRLRDILEQDYEVVLVGRSDVKPTDGRVIAIKPARTRLWNLKLVPVLLRNRFDYIYCLDSITFLTLYLLAPLRKFKVIFDVRNIIPRKSAYGAWRPLHQWLLNFAVKRASYVVAEVEYAFEYYKRFTRNICLIPLFVDETVFKRSNRVNKPQADGAKVIGVIGPFLIDVNQVYLDFLYDNLGKFDSRIRFVVIGECHRKIKSDRITYTGYLPSLQDYVDQLSSLDGTMLIHKPLDPGPYTKILDSMACSLPVFTTPQGMLGIEYAQPGRDILVFEQDRLVDKVNELVFNEGLMREIGSNARIAVEKFYSRSANKNKLLQILEGLGTSTA